MQYERFLRDEHKSLTNVGQKFTAAGREYILQGNLGNGAIGMVRKAKDVKNQKQVAVKFLAPEPRYIEPSSFEDIHARFRREGARGSELNHQNLVKVVAYEENENAANFLDKNGPCNPFIIMEYINGTTLEHFIMKNGNQPFFNINTQTLSIAHAVTNALYYLHSRNIVHRDVKPANIYLTRVSQSSKPDAVKLGDFGVVKWGDFKASMTTGNLTVSGQLGLGTWKYMSPEQATKPKEVSVRSDMYSLGITLFELFTNQIFPSPHHVFQIAQQRHQRGNVISKLYDLGIGILPGHFSDLFSLIYDMFLTSPKGRPSSRDMEGRLRYYIEQAQYEIASETPP